MSGAIVEPVIVYRRFEDSWEPELDELGRPDTKGNADDLLRWIYYATRNGDELAIMSCGGDVCFFVTCVDTDVRFLLGPIRGGTR